MGIDMGNTFSFICGFFHAHVVERTYLCGATSEVRKVGLEGPTKHVAVVPSFWNEPQERLQMDSTIRTGRTSWSSRPGVPAPRLAAANILGVAEANSRSAATTPELGKQEAGSSTAQRISGRSCTLCADHWQVAEANEAEPSSAPPLVGMI